jgi:hypothetical protein
MLVDRLYANSHAGLDAAYKFMKESRTVTDELFKRQDLYHRPQQGGAA